MNDINLEIRRSLESIKKTPLTFIIDFESTINLINIKVKLTVLLHSS